MKFSKRIEGIKNKEENTGKIVLIRCGIFFIAIGNDAILLYLELIEQKGYGYILYDYEKETKELIFQYKYEGQKNTEKQTCKNCKECANYKGCWC